MGLLISQESEFGKESWRWEHTKAETHPNDPTIHGMRPVDFQAYPAMLYKALQKNPWKFEEQVVHSSTEQASFETMGFIAGGQGEAAKAFDGYQDVIAQAAAERNYQDRNMSEAAKAHSSEVEQASSAHLGEIPRTPVRPRRARRTKAQIAADAAKH